LAPASYDFRTRGVINPIQNQANCGGCYAFASVANIESLYALKYGILYKFSEQQILDCNSNGNGCNGGTAGNVYSSIGNLGLQRTATYGAFLGYASYCTFNSAYAVAKLGGWYKVSTNEASILSFLYSNGPLSVALNATPLQLYTGGIINLSSLSCNPNDLDHAVTLIGDGTSNGLNYWIVRNQWGIYWGESGYFRISRGSETCGINLLVTSAIVN